MNKNINEDMLSQSAIQEKLVSMMAKQLKKEPEAIEVSEEIANYGMDSIDAIMLAGDLEDSLGLELPSTLLWDYPTIKDIAAYLSEEIQGSFGLDSSFTQQDKGVEVR
jgi:acyl carrier protein